MYVSIVPVGKLTYNLTPIIQMYILTDMKRILVSVEDRHLPLLDKSKNKSKLVRDSLDLMMSDIPSPVERDILKGTIALYKLVKEVDSKLDYLAKEKNETTISSS